MEDFIKQYINFKIMAKKINVLDPTIREVGFINNFNFSLKQVKNLASALEKAGCNWIELGHGNGLGNTCLLYTSKTNCIVDAWGQGSCRRTQITEMGLVAKNWDMFIILPLKCI